MIRKNFVILLISIMVLFHFSPAITHANTASNGEEEQTSQKENQSSEEVNKDSDVPQKDDFQEEVEEDNNESSQENENSSSQDKEVDNKEEEDSEEEHISNENSSEEQETTPREEEEEGKSDSKQVEPFAVDASIPYEKGDRHEDLVEIKEKLNHIGFDGITETDYFGNWTETRVTQFQTYYQLSVTGKVDQKTINKLDSVYNSSFQNGKRHEDTKAIKEKLNSIGYGPITVTTLFGNYMESQVKEFQRDQGLRVNGIADERTLAKLEELASTDVFELGDRHNAIITIKEKLNAIGFGGISETNYFGGWTETRVKQFQQYYGLSVDGKVGPATQETLDSVYNSPFQNDERHEDTKAIKEKLNSIGYGPITVTTLFGNYMESQVKEFQRDQGLRVNGIADGPTLAKLEELASTDVFELGDRHSAIITIKEKLNAVGFDRISETDYFGGWTETRVRQFQEYYNLNVTGKADEATQNKLDEVYNSPFQAGKRHEDTIELKEKLNRIGYGHITVSTLYGNYTKSQVKEFQRDFGLVVNGIADENTWIKLNEVYYKTGFQLGDRHEDIIEIKKQLNAIGFGGITETNYFGKWTETRVEQFQRYYGLSVTGTADEQTQQKLSDVYNSPYQNGKRHDGTIELKEKLNRIGFGYITVSTLYGSFTESQVNKFQEYYGLKVSGIADEVTMDMINEIYNSPLQKGKSDSRVIEMKEMLNALGYDGITISDYFGNWTETRLKQFQSDYNLPVSGIADTKTIQKLDDSVIRVFLDPGHGGNDPGGQGYGINEKDVVLDIALQTEQFLSSKYKGVLVNMSRTDDTFIELTERANMANRWGADYFVSFHTNAFNGSANGFETYIHNGNVSNETKQRQSDVHSYLINNINVNDRGKKTANFNVLRNTNMSSILLEYMFIDNFVENMLLKDPSYRTYLAQITADAIANSYNLKRR
ncbi:peptidoglycan-binding protein [Oceanobacillus iheyensis]|uniref:peptidoglycan-binding protein n=1 Tax=Oceanobacillus iheyensis TaxID=182710 RepID=UPI0036422E07